jgi:hypothetical protein
MSRQLPARPNLDHLKHQAKDLLQSARTLHPDWQLADAQFALARGYGFSSWPTLKAHVDAIVREPGADGPPAAPGAAIDLTDESPMTGTWVANVAASRRHPAMLFQSASLEVTVTGPRVRLTQLLVDAEGKKAGGALTIETDGIARQPDGTGAAHALTARWLDARTLEVIDTMDGRDIGRGRYAVSIDGRRLTVSTAEQELVFDRV